MTEDHGGPDLASKVGHVGRISPALQRHLAGSAPTLRNATLGDREWGLLTMSMLIDLGDAPDQLRTYLDIAGGGGATNDEIVDVINQAAIYVGGPRAVNAIRTLDKWLAAERNRLLPDVAETVIRVDDHETVMWDNGGDGTPMLLLHCMSLDRRVWRDVYPKLAGTGRVIAYDIRNHGWARGAPLVGDLDHVAADAATLLDVLGIAEADVYGASYGGGIAQHLVLNHPDRVRALALIATSPWCPTRRSTSGPRALRPAAWRRRWRSRSSAGSCPTAIAENGWAVRYAREMIRRDSVEEWAASWRPMARLDVVDRLADIKVPTVAIAGAQDLSSIPAALEAKRTRRPVSTCSPPHSRPANDGEVAQRLFVAGPSTIGWVETDPRFGCRAAVPRGDSKAGGEQTQHRASRAGTLFGHHDGCPFVISWLPLVSTSVQTRFSRRALRRRPWLANVFRSVWRQ